MSDTEVLDPTAPPPVRRLYRSRSTRMVGGVCGGLADYTGLDAVIFRIGFAVLTLAGASGVLLYALAWLFVPLEGTDRSGIDLARARSASWLPVAMVFVGVAMLSGRVLGDGDDGFFAVALIGLGAWLLWRTPRSGGSGADRDDVADGGGWPDSDPGGWNDTDGWERTVDAPTRRRSPAGRITFSALLIATGAAVLLDSTGAIDVSAAGFLAAATVLVGVGLAASAWSGGSRGLIVLGAALAISAAATASIDVPFGGGAGERRWRPASVARLTQGYRLGAGEAVLDLTGIEGTEAVTGSSRARVRVGMGDLLVLVPDDLAVTVRARVGIGEAEVFGRSEDGVGVRITGRSGGELRALPLDIRIGIGHLEVRRVPA